MDGSELKIVFWTSLVIGALLLFSLVKKEKSERQKIWGEIQAAAKEAGIDLTKAGKKRAR